tara:strand:- start:1262 stop:1879 length:618 start_codon:yes stop_codon:yes gene_type:complete
MYKVFSNTGIMKEKLSNKAMNKLKSYMKKRTSKGNRRLAGNISDSFFIEDKDDWFFNNVLLYLIQQYTEGDLKAIVPAVLTKNCSYVLDSIWVNYQNKYEFNPVHCHQGVFSFVVWMEIPSSYKKEKKLKFVKESNSQCPNTFEFIFTNMLGAVSTERYYLEPEDKGTILLFPSNLLHQVYPFYLSNKKRISIAGNIKLDPTKIV